MRILLVVDRRNARRWHARLRDRLTRLIPGASIALVYENGAGGYPVSVDLLLTLEKLLLRRRHPALCESIAPEPGFDISAAEGDPDVVIDLTGREKLPKAPSGALVLRPLYAGCPDEMAAIAAGLEGSAPLIGIEDAGRGVVIGQGLPSFEAATGLTESLDAVFSRTVTLIEQALLSPPRTRDVPSVQTNAPTSRGTASFLLRSVTRHCARKIYHLCCHSPHWRIGWRFNDGAGVLETGGLGGPQWSVLPGSSAGFCADPFPVEWRGQSCIFFEFLDYRAGKGAIFAQKFDAKGPSGPPFPVIEEAWHLSYPSLVVRDGELFMVPEASASGAVSIYRCIEFPSKWRRESQLLTGIEAADPTIFRHAGRFWMTSAVRDGFGGYSDTLAIHYATDLLGPWREHAERPALVDSRLARPAGAVTTMNGELWRPAQDCSTGYGKRLALVRIDALDPEHFSQTSMGLIAPGRIWPGDRLHTLNRWGRLECIDGAVQTPKNKVLRLLTASVARTALLRASA